MTRVSALAGDFWREKHAGRKKNESGSDRSRLRQNYGQSMFNCGIHRRLKALPANAELIIVARECLIDEESEFGEEERAAGVGTEIYCRFQLSESICHSPAEHTWTSLHRSI